MVAIFSTMRCGTVLSCSSSTPKLAKGSNRKASRTRTHPSAVMGMSLVPASCLRRRERALSTSSLLSLVFPFLPPFPLGALLPFPLGGPPARRSGTRRWPRSSSTQRLLVRLAWYWDQALCHWSVSSPGCSSGLLPQSRARNAPRLGESPLPRGPPFSGRRKRSRGVCVPSQRTDPCFFDALDRLQTCAWGGQNLRRPDCGCLCQCQRWLFQACSGGFVPVATWERACKAEAQEPAGLVGSKRPGASPSSTSQSESFWGVWPSATQLLERRAGSGLFGS